MFQTQTPVLSLFLGVYELKADLSSPVLDVTKHGSVLPSLGTEDTPGFYPEFAAKQANLAHRGWPMYPGAP